MYTVWVAGGGKRALPAAARTGPWPGGVGVAGLGVSPKCEDAGRRCGARATACLRGDHRGRRSGAVRL